MASTAGDKGFPFKAILLMGVARIAPLVMNSKARGVTLGPNIHNAAAAESTTLAAISASISNHSVSNTQGSGRIHFNLELGASSSMTNYWGSWGHRKRKREWQWRRVIGRCPGTSGEIFVSSGPEKWIKGVGSPSCGKSQKEMMTKPPTRNVGICQRSDQDQCDTGLVGRRSYYEAARKLTTTGEQKSEKYITHLKK
uniref:Uncharacterized protein n=1 Tax=Romanomermis culicivorax TaxID=13658 RepID=A0A915HXI2_ROMCU